MTEPARRRFLARLAIGLSAALQGRGALARTEAEVAPKPREVAPKPRSTRSIPDDAPDSWRAVIAAYAQLRTYREELSGVIEHRILGTPIRTTCRSRTWFVAPRSFRHEMDGAGPSRRPSSIFLHDGAESWDYDPESGWQAVESIRKLTSGLFGGSIAYGGQGYWNLSMLVPEDDLAYPSLRTLSGVVVQGEDTLDGERCVVFEGIYRRRDSLRIWAAGKSQMILRIDCKFSDTETATFRYRPATNVAISPDELARRPQGNEA